MESEKSMSKLPSSICLICGDVARGLNFDVTTCMSCKSFFRRHAHRQPQEPQCQLNGNCIITQQTRGGCLACRLKKCFVAGMNPQLIRVSPRKTTTSTYQSNIKTDEKQQICLSQPTTLSLLSRDYSTLTFDDWNLISNTIHAYDEQNLIIRTQCSLREQSSLPLKIRSKQSNTLHLIGSFYTAIQPFIERSPYFHNLPTDARRILIQNNLSGTGALNSMFAAAEAKVFDIESHVATCNEIYGADYVKESERLLKRMDLNGTLIKMMLIILVFSSNCSIVLPDHTFNSTDTSVASSIILIRIQDSLVVILWKYLVHQYGFIGAVRRLDFLVKNYLDVLNRVNENSSKQHVKMVDVIIDKVSQSLTSDK